MNIKIKDVQHQTIFQDSKIAHKYLDGRKGIEIGASAHNPFNLDTINVDFTDAINVFKQAEINLCGSYAEVDIVADALHLPFKNNSYDFVISSHVLEHCYDLISVIKECKRVIKKNGYILSILPLPEICPNDPKVTFSEFKKRIGIEKLGDQGHCSMCTIDTFIEIGKSLNLELIETENPDKKVGNGYLVLFKKVTK